MGSKNLVEPLFSNGIMMGSSAGSAAILYCCVFYGKKKLYCYSNGDSELESFADLWLENVPPFHSWYFHSTRRRTHGFLMENEHTYFVIANSGIGSQELLKFLKSISHGYRKKLSGTGCSEGPKTPLPSDKHDREKTKERASDDSDNKVHFARTRGVDVGTSPEKTSTFRLWKSQSQQTTWMSWLRQQLKMIIVVDVILCLFLFMIGLMICRGFKCVSSG